MAFISTEKLFTRRWFSAYGQILAGALLIAAGYVLFITPYKVVPGGVYGICIILHHTWGLPVGLTALAFNIPITLLALKVLGPRYGAKTVAGFILTSFFIDGLTFLVGEDPLKIGDEILMSSLYGGVMIGLGVGLLFRARASCGGTDMVAMMLSKKTRLPVGRLMIYVDSAIVLMGLVAFKDWHIPLYSWVVIYITGRAIDMILEGADYNKALLIVSKNHEDIKNKILVDLERGGTYLRGEGMFTGEEKQIIYTVVSRREMAVLQEYIGTIDPDSFITVMDAREILGEGFQSLRKKVEAG